MDIECRQLTKNCTANPSDAGHGNKMASSSSTSNGTKTVEYELKIMEVEGAIPTGLPIIQLDDDVDVDIVTVPFVSELKTAIISQTDLENQDPLHEDQMSAKAEAISDVESVGSYSGPDPMGLLERIDSSREVIVGHDDDDADEEGDSVEEGDEVGSTGSRRYKVSNRWQIWMKRWPWLLHEESDGDFAFCLYCNVAINVNKKTKYLQQHNLSLYHQEREINYLAFKNSEKQTSESDDSMKYEFGSNNYVVAMKQRRVNEVEKLNNFNWERWLKWHSWLERTQPTGTIGLCKCCNIRMNVEFVYLRKRHESSKGHCEALKQQDKPSRKRKRSVSPAAKPDETVPTAESQNSPKKHAEEAVPAATPESAMTVIIPPTENSPNIETVDPSDWCEMLPDTIPQQCRCTLCDVRMSITSFMRHLKTQVHCNNLEREKGEKIIDRGIWAQYAEKHPWLVADPEDPTMAYCHICCRRFIYGHSEIKRKNHENSENHQAKLAASKITEVAEAVPVDNMIQSEPEQSDIQTETEGTDEDYVDEDNRLSTSQKSSIGRIEKAAKKSRPKRLMAKKMMNIKGTILEQEQINDESVMNNDATDNSADESTISNRALKAAAKAAIKQQTPTTMHGRVMAWRERFPWISYKRSEERQNYGWCKLCDTSVFLPSCKFASRHQRSSRHIRLRFERKRAVKENALGGVSMAAATAAALATGEAKHKAAMAELQSKYAWLEGDATDENYCHCKICDARLPIKVFYLRQHDGSRKHIDNLERVKSTEEVTPEIEPAKEQPNTNSTAMDVDQDSDEALSVKSECSVEEQTSSKRSRRAMELRRILRALRDSAGGKRHEERSQMDMARDMICSSFDIVKRLRTLERETDQQTFSYSPMHLQHRGITDSLAGSRSTIDLFFDSITQTMKSLPADLAAEGKAKIMRIVSDLELRNLQRTASPPSPSQMEGQNDSTHNLNSFKQAHKERMTFEEVIEATPDSPDSDTSSVIIDEHADESTPTPLQRLLNSNNNNNDMGHLTEITVTPSQCPAKSKVSLSPQKSITPNNVNGLGKEVPANIRSILPSTVQIGTKADSAVDSQLRVVPINKLTTPNHNNARNSLNGSNSTSTALNRSGQSTKLSASSNQIALATPPTSSSSNHSDFNNDTSTTPSVFHKIRVSNGTSTKVIRFQKNPVSEHQLQHQQHSTPQRALVPPSPHKGAMRFFGGVNTPNNHHGQVKTPTQSQIHNHNHGHAQAQALAQAQLRALKAQRPFTTIRPSQP